jgi:hypothetical protein
MVTIPFGDPFICNTTRKVVDGDLLTDSMHVTLTTGAISQERACCKTHYGFFGDYASDLNTHSLPPTPECPEESVGRNPAKDDLCIYQWPTKLTTCRTVCHQMETKVEVKGDSIQVKGIGKVLLSSCTETHCQSGHCQSGPWLIVRPGKPEGKRRTISTSALKTSSGVFVDGYEGIYKATSPGVYKWEGPSYAVFTEKRVNKIQKDIFVQILGVQTAGLNEDCRQDGAIETLVAGLGRVLPDSVLPLLAPGRKLVAREANSTHILAAVCHSIRCWSYPQKDCYEDQPVICTSKEEPGFLAKATGEYKKVSKKTPCLIGGWEFATPLGGATLTGGGIQEEEAIIAIIQSLSMTEGHAAGVNTGPAVVFDGDGVIRNKDTEETVLEWVHGHPLAIYVAFGFLVLWCSYLTITMKRPRPYMMAPNLEMTRMN